MICAVRYETAINFYKTSKAMADAAQVSEAAVSKWKTRRIVPKKSAERLQTASGARIQVDGSVYVRKKRKDAGKPRRGAARARA